jgi:O-antigen ligase
MIKFLKKNFSVVENKDIFFLIVLFFFPLSLILGNLIINLFFILSLISFFINFNESSKYLKNKIIVLLFFFFLSLIINVFFSLNPLNSLPRAIKIILVIAFVIETSRLINKYNFDLMKNIFKIWALFFFVILLDSFFEIFFGFNTIGMKSTLSTRVASFFGDELVVGAFIHGFALFFISYLFFIKTNKNIFMLCVLIILIGSFLIGERSNFLKLFVSMVIFGMIAINFSKLNKILSLLFVLTCITTIVTFNENMKFRYYYELSGLFEKNGIQKFYKGSQYGAHQNTALKIFKDFPVFGVGLKNFRYESNKEKYANEEYAQTNARSANHPHQIHFEFLSETGLFGYISFITFILISLIISINSYFKTKNIFQLSAIIFIISSLIPILPSGSFLSTFNSSIFWINFAVMAGFNQNSKFKF